MGVVLLGSTGKVNQALIKKLVSDGVETTVVTRSAQKVADIEALGAKAAVGTIDDGDFLTASFKGADAAFIVSAVDYFTDKFYEETYAQMDTIIKSILASDIQNIVYLSSLGAHTVNSGLLKFHYNNELKMKEKLAGLNSVSFVRPGKFYANFLTNLPDIKATGDIHIFYDDVKPHSLASMEDIADTVAQLLEHPSPNEKFGVHYVESERLTTSQIRDIFAKALNLPNLKWITIPNQAAVDLFVSYGMNRQTVTDLISALSADLHDELHEDLFKTDKVVPTKYPLSEYAANVLKPAYDKL